MLKCDFNKLVLQLFCNCVVPFPKSTSGGLLLSKNATLMQNNKKCQMADTNFSIPFKNKQIYHKQINDKRQHNQFNKG